MSPHKYVRITNGDDDVSETQSTLLRLVHEEVCFIGKHPIYWEPFFKLVMFRTNKIGKHPIYCSILLKSIY